MRFSNKFNVILIVFFSSFCLTSSGQGDWDTGGNNLLSTGTFGSSSNFDILFQTDGINRMRLMETGNTTIDGYTIPHDGHLGLSLTPSFFGTTGAAREPYSLLHLNGFQNNPAGPQAFGYRDCLPTASRPARGTRPRSTGQKRSTIY